VIPARPDGALAPTGGGPTGGGPRGLPSVTFPWWEALVVFLVGNLLLGGIAYAVVVGTGEPTPTQEIVAGLAVDAVFLGAMLWWLSWRHPGSRAALGTRWSGRSVAAAAGLGALLYAVVALALAGGVTWLFDRISETPVVVPSQLPEELGPVASVLAVFLAVVAAPVVEELYFRGILYRSVRDPHGVAAGTAVSASLFGLAHLMPGEGIGVWVIPVVMVVTGVVLAQIYERSGSIVTPIVAHMAFNAIGITLILAGVG
jgi:membrane protease YdiL (CAAX protease family)